VAEQQHGAAVTIDSRAKMVAAIALADEFDGRAGTAQKTGEDGAAAVDSHLIGARRFESDQRLDRPDRVGSVLMAILEEILHASRL
jgi:hypothetical protein